MFEDEYFEDEDELDEAAKMADEVEGEDARGLSENELLNMMVLYKNRLIMEAINNGLSSGFVGVCLLELSIPTLCVSIPKEEVISALKETIATLEDEEKFGDLQKDIDKLGQLYMVMNDEPEGTA